MKTILEHLEELPEPYRSQAIINALNKEVENQQDALWVAFTWHKTPEGYDYWKTFYNSLKNEGK